MIPTIYLSGPIAGCEDSEANDWRTLVENLSSVYHFKTKNPMVRDYREFDNKVMPLATVNLIVEEDKIDIDLSQALIVNYDETERCVGTVMETIYAWEKGKIVVVVTRPGYFPSPWLVYHSHYQTHSHEDAIKYIMERIG